jgi:hypothetical protein
VAFSVDVEGAAIPEPATAALIAMGICALLLRRKLI